LAPGLWKFLADLATVFAFGGLGAAYLSNQRKYSNSLGKILFLAGAFVIVSAGFAFFYRNGLPGLVILLLSLAVLALFIRYAEGLRNTFI